MKVQKGRDPNPCFPSSSNEEKNNSMGGLLFAQWYIKRIMNILSTKMIIKKL